MVVTLGIYYVVPWIRWPRGEGLPDQAVLIDVANGRLFLGPIEIWPQELYYVTGILIISALGSVPRNIARRPGLVRLCTCPQTVWTDLMIAVERFWQGDRNTRIRSGQGAVGAVEDLQEDDDAFLTWLLIGLLTGGALVFYFPRCANTGAGTRKR